MQLFLLHFLSNAGVCNLALKIRALAFRNVKVSLSVVKIVICVISGRKNRSVSNLGIVLAAWVCCSLPFIFHFSHFN